MNSFYTVSLPKALASLLGAGLVSMGISTLATPQSSTAAYGIPQKTPINPFVYVFASRETSLGLAILALAAVNEWRAVGVVMATLGVSGLSDLVLDAKYGRGFRTACFVHGVPTVVMVPVVWALLRQ